MHYLNLLNQVTEALDSVYLDSVGNERNLAYSGKTNEIFRTKNTVCATGETRDFFCAIFRQRKQRFGRDFELDHFS